MSLIFMFYFISFCLSIIYISYFWLVLITKPTIWNLLGSIECVTNKTISMTVRVFKIRRAVYFHLRLRFDLYIWYFFLVFMFCFWFYCLIAVFIYFFLYLTTLWNVFAFFFSPYVRERKKTANCFIVFCICGWNFNCYL